MDVIFFNGPPKCGKDEAAKFLRANWDALDLPGNPILRRFSHPNKMAFAGLVDAKIDADGNVETWEAAKDHPHPLLNGKSYRQWQIDFSEKFMKPLYGDDIFGRLFVNAVHDKTNSSVYLVPDCGFEVEPETVVTLLPKARVFLIRIYRRGCDFSLDSRSYIEAPSIPYENVYNIHNNGDLAHYHDTLAKLSTSIFGFRRPH